MRWWIAGLLALATALSYLDRQSFPLIIDAVRRDIPITDAEYARLGALFLIAYGLMYAGGGRILDALGTRAGYALMITVWSAANFLTGFVNSVLGLGIFRFLLGMGEGGGFPGSGKAVAEWFPPRERSFAFGLFNTGSALGAVVAAPALTFIAARWGWRWVFFATGAAGFAWAVAWLRLYSTPPPAAAEAGLRLRWRDLFRYRQVWGLMGAKLLTDSVWFFLIFWIPKYLADRRGFDLKSMGTVAWIPFAAAGVGSLFGGWLGARLIRGGVPLDRARKICLGAAAALLPAALLIGPSSTPWAVACMSVAFLGHQFWSANVQTLAADLFPARVVGSVEGLLGSAGALGAGLAQWRLGDLIAARGYGLPFAVAGVLHLGAFGLILLVVRRIEVLTLEPDSDVSTLQRGA